MTSRLLSRQLRRHFGAGSAEELQQTVEELRALAQTSPRLLQLADGMLEFVEKVDASYEQSERDLQLAQRSLQLSSAELSAVNERLHEEASLREQTLQSLQETTNRLLAPLGRHIDEGDGLEKLTVHLDELVTDLFSTRRELEKTLKELGNRQFALDQHAIVSIADRGGRITYANERFCAISGFSREELLGKNHRVVKSAVHDPDFYRDMWETIIAGKVWHGDICNRSRDGSHYWVAATIVPILDGEGVPGQYISIRTDITEQKQLEANFKREQNFLQSVMQTLGEGVYVLDEKGICTLINREAEEMLGWNRSEMEGCNLHDLIHFQKLDGSPQSREDCPTFCCIRDGKVYESDSDAFTRRDGTIFPISIVATPLLENGKVIGSVAAFQNVTEQKRAVAEIVKAKDAAERANRAKSDFLATMSHEIRTPMNGIIGMTELALDTNLNSDQREYLLLVKSSADSLLDIINDILDFSKIEAGHLTLERVPFRVDEVVRTALRPLGVRAMQKELELVYEPDTRIPEVLLGDPGRLRQILVNLVGNAIKFSPRGEIRIQARLEQVIAQDVLIRVDVVDNGIGVPVEKQASIFDPFTQADTSMTRRFGGTGLGLAICSRLVTTMGGSIGVESRPDEGSTFHFTLKLGLGSTNDAPSFENALPENLPLPAAPMVTALNILLAEDNLVNQKLAMTLLGKWGHRIRLANNGREAVEFSASEPFDLILMDVQMPLLGGIEATRLIREREAEGGNHVRIVAMTANAMAGDREACIDAGMDDYLTKPLKKKMLAAILDPSPSDPQQPAESPEQNGMFDYAAALTSADSWVIEVIGETFRKDWPKQVKTMQAAIGNSERDVLLRGAHTLKGLLGNFNAAPAQALARKLELLATQGEFEQSTPCLVELAVALGLLDRALETFTQTVQ